MSVMEEIRKLWSEGWSSGKIIRTGYAPGTVYNVQRQMRRRDTKAAPRKSESSVPELDGQYLAQIAELEAENSELRQYREPFENLHVELGSLQAQFEAAQARIHELEGEVTRVAVLSQQIKNLESRIRVLERAALALGGLVKDTLERPPDTLFGKLAVESELECLLIPLQPDVGIPTKVSSLPLG